MLGYRGRSNRREFIGAAALLTVGPIAFSMVMIPAIPLLMGGLQRNAALFVGLLLTLVVLVVLVVCLWAWTALVTRRARDIGWPAWVGLVVTAALFVLASLTWHPVLYGWLAILAVLRSDLARRRADAAETFA
jgi:uncharacterized membrane protein YhaH (DUF805 family)